MTIPQARGCYSSVKGGPLINLISLWGPKITNDMRLEGRGLRNSPYKSTHPWLLSIALNLLKTLANCL